MALIVFNSTTTYTRVRLVERQQVLYACDVTVGVQDVAKSGNSDILKRAIKEGIDKVAAARGGAVPEIEAVIAFGMTTSNLGLIEIPHVPTPENLCSMARNIFVQAFPEIVDQPILFVPGVKFGTSGDLPGQDMMRGEEVEVAGYDYSESNADVLFMHYGGHHKCILARNGVPVQSKTSITGELAAVIAQHTTLKSTVGRFTDLPLDPTWVKRGFAEAQNSGFGRTLFLVRVLQTMEKRSEIEVASFFLGVLSYLDINVIESMLTPATEKIVLYGKELFPPAMKPILQEYYPQLEVTALTEAQSEQLIVRGAINLYDAWQEQECIVR